MRDKRIKKEKERERERAREREKERKRRREVNRVRERKRERERETETWRGRGRHLRSGFVSKGFRSILLKNRLFSSPSVSVMTRPQRKPLVCCGTCFFF